MYARLCGATLAGRLNLVGAPAASTWRLAGAWERQARRAADGMPGPWESGRVQLATERRPRREGAARMGKRRRLRQNGHVSHISRFTHSLEKCCCRAQGKPQASLMEMQSKNNNPPKCESIRNNNDNNLVHRSSVSHTLSFSPHGVTRTQLVQPVYVDLPLPVVGVCLMEEFGL